MVAPTPDALDADRRRDEHTVSAILRRQQQRSEELRQRRQEALDRDRQAALEAARSGKVLCAHCGCWTDPLEERCWSCEQLKGLGEGLVEPPCARLYELSVAALAELRRGADPALHRASGVRDAAEVTPVADQSRGLDGAQGALGVKEGA